MQQKIYTQYEGIQTGDLKTLLDAMNRYQRQHADSNPIGRIETIGNTFWGVVEYTVDVRVPETELEKLEEEMGKHRCYECPCLEVESDKRRKSWPCTIGGESRTDAPCCEWFYKQLKEGKINP